MLSGNYGVRIRRVCPDCDFEKEVVGYEGDAECQLVRCAPCKAVRRFEEQGHPCINCGVSVDGDGCECQRCDMRFCADCVDRGSYGAKICASCGAYLDSIRDQIFDGYAQDADERENRLYELEDEG